MEPASADRASTPIPLFDEPVVEPTVEKTPASRLLQLLGNSARPAAAARPSPTSDPISSSAPPGLRPDEALLLRPLELGPDNPVDWRPPPVDVPYALDPNDHYWLSRPIPSDRRNYELEWYPYGIEPTLPEALPYRVHHGADFPNDPGTPVHAAGSGTVIWAGPLLSPRDGVNYYGNTIIIHHDWQWRGKDVYTLYAHTLELFVESGERVEKGQLLAGVGSSGDVSGPHLHLEVRVGANNYGSTRNPALWLAPYDGWGTLAGRFVDERGRLITGALVTVRPEFIEGDFDAPTRIQRTYYPAAINSDEFWRENFVVGDLPAGRYTLFLSAGGRTYKRDVQLLPGRTNFIIVQADFRFVPTATATPAPTATPEPTETPDPSAVAG